jgi:Ca2+-binding RTX toxin-like protein
MAVATAHKPVNMNTFEIWDEYDVPQYSSTYIRQIGFDGERQDWFGHGFTFNLTNGTLTGGTVTQTIGYQDGVKQFTITGLNHSALTIYNELNSFDAQGLLGYAFNGNDQMTGSSGADAINGYNGNDKIDGGGGADKINGGAGNDTLVYGAGDTLNGAGGTLDTLQITVSSVDLSNNTANPNTRLLNFEQVDVRSGAHTLKLGKADVLDMSSTSTIKILGDSGDTVNIVGTQSEGGSAPTGFTRYTIGSAILIIDSDVNVM